MEKESVFLDVETLSRYHCVLIVTNHSNVDYNLLQEKAALIIDTRNALRLNGLTNGNVVKA